MLKIYRKSNTHFLSGSETLPKEIAVHSNNYTLV